MSQKLALIIGNSQYDDTSLSRLKTPDADVNALAEVLRAPDVGSFDAVATLVNQPATAVRREVARFFGQKTRDDLLVLYFSGHGVLDDRGRLYLAVKDTERELLSGTAVPASFVTDEMDRSWSRRQVLILDCCHSGAFARGAKGVVGASVGTAIAFEGSGTGRVVLTATDSTQYAWEGDEVTGQAENSVFTRYLIEGLRTGQADIDGDGQITLDELYDYVYGQVVTRTPKQAPGKWSYKQQGEIIIARNPRPVVKLVELPAELRQAIESPFASVREGAARELDRLLRGSHAGLAQAAREALKRLADDDSRRVSTAAAGVLAANADAQRAQEREREEQARRARGAAQAETEGLAAQQAAAEMAEVKPEPPAHTIGHAAVRAKAIGLSALLTAIGWGVGFVIGVAITGDFGGADGWAFAGGIGGLATGMALQRAELSRQQIERALVVVVGWALAGAIGWGIAGAIGDTISEATNDAVFGAGDWATGKVVGWFIGWAIFGAIVSLTLWRVTASLSQRQSLAMIGVWLMAGAIGWTIPEALADMIEAIGFAILPDEGYTVAAAINRIVAWTSAGAIGSAVIFWWLSQLGSIKAASD